MDLFSLEDIYHVRCVWEMLRNDPIVAPQPSEQAQATASAFFCQQFYDKLLSEHPELKLLFPNIRQQAAAMANTLNDVISNLGDLSRIQPKLVALGKIHSRIMGVQTCHYELVGDALMDTLQDRCQESYSPELDRAWKKLYCYVANTMLGDPDPDPDPSSGSGSVSAGSAGSAGSAVRSAFGSTDRVDTTGPQSADATPFASSLSSSLGPSPAESSPGDWCFDGQTHSHRQSRHHHHQSHHQSHHLSHHSSQHPSHHHPNGTSKPTSSLQSISRLRLKLRRHDLSKLNKLFKHRS